MLTLHQIDSAQNQSLILELDKEILKIEKLQEAIIMREGKRSEGRGSLVLMSPEPEPKLLYTDIFSLYERKQGLQRNLEIYKEIIVVVQNLTPLEMEEKPVLKYVVIFGGAMAVLGLFCSLCWQYRKRIWELIREDSYSR
jgi:hypothetical protein